MNKKAFAWGYSMSGLVLGLFITTTSYAGNETKYTSTLYVDANSGQPDGVGSQSNPFKTIQAALNVVKPGTRVFVKAGAYEEELQVRTSGTETEPILIEGEFAPDRKPLAWIRGGKEITNWEPAPEVGQGVFKTTKLGFLPNNMETGEGKNLDCIPAAKGNAGSDSHDVQPCMDDGSALSFFATGLDLECSADNTEHAKGKKAQLEKVKFWDVTHGIFGTTKGTTYVRLKDKLDPNVSKLRVTNSASTILFKNIDHVTWKGFRVSGFGVAFTLEGSDTHHVVIQDNTIIAGKIGVSLNPGNHHILIQGNDITMNHFGVQGGAWGSAQPTYEQNLNQAFYQWPHHWIFNGSGMMGISMISAGDDNEISGNHLHGGMVGIFYRQSDVKKEGRTTHRLKIHDNRIHQQSSGGIALYEGLVDAEIYNNVLENNNFHVRMQSMERPDGRRLFIYNNRFHQAEDVGLHIKFHWGKILKKPNPQPEVYIYHNSFSGSSRAFSGSMLDPQISVFPKVYFLNNMISSKNNTPPISGDPQSPQPVLVGAFDYNWVGTLFSGKPPPPWMGEHNLKSDLPYFWDPKQKQDFKIPPESPAMEAGLDLSKPFKLNGIEIPPLPGMKPGYFKGKAPPLGVYTD